MTKPGRRYRRRRRCPGCQAMVVGNFFIVDVRRRRWHFKCAQGALGAQRARRGRPPATLARPREVVSEQEALFTDVRQTQMPAAVLEPEGASAP